MIGINGNKPIKEFLTEKDLEMLYKIKISKNEKLKNAIDILQDYIDKNSLDENSNYINILKKMYDILPVY